MRSGRVEATTPNLLEQMGYETRDIKLNRIFFWIGVLFAFAFVGMAAAWGVYVFFIPNYAKLGQPSQIPPNRRLPPNPQVQVEPVRDMALFRTAEDNASNPKAIEGAMDTIANERGIAGVKGNTVHGRGDSYPGSGNYAGPGGAVTGNTNVLESTNDPQVGEKPLPGSVEKEPGNRAETPGEGTAPSGETGSPAAPVTAPPSKAAPTAP